MQTLVRETDTLYEDICGLNCTLEGSWVSRDPDLISQNVFKLFHKLNYLT